MNEDELSKIIRRGDRTLRVDDLVLDDGVEKRKGKGHLRIQRKKLTILMVLNSMANARRMSGPGVVTKSEFWKLTGLIEHSLRFHCNFGPGLTYRVHNKLRSFEGTVNPIELEPRGSCTLPIRERKTRWKRIRKAFKEPFSNAAFEAAEAERLADGSFEFEAHFVKHELRSMNEGTKIERKHPFTGGEGGVDKLDTLMGETSSYKFAFIQADDSDDLRLILRSKDGQPPLNETEHWKKYYSLIQAISFVHGINAWPYRLQYRRGGDTYCDRLAPARPAPRSPQTPFSGLGHEVDLATFVPKVAEMLEPATAFNEDLSTLMYLFRQAGAKGVHRKIGALALCSSLEGLTTLLFKQFGLNNSSNPARYADFDARKADLLVHIDGLDKNNPSISRLREFVSSAQAVRRLKVEEKFEEVCKHLGLPWDKKMKLVREAWEELRNPLAHGDFREGESISEQIFKSDTIAKSRIAGGFNTILLKFFGYTGLYKSSVFELGHDQMS